MSSPAAVQVIAYSEKSIAVVGDTRSIKEELILRGGMWNSRLRIGGRPAMGWIFHVSKRALVEAFLSGLSQSCAAAAQSTPVSGAAHATSTGAGTSCRPISSDDPALMSHSAVSGGNEGIASSPAAAADQAGRVQAPTAAVANVAAVALPEYVAAAGVAMPAVEGVECLSAPVSEVVGGGESSLAVLQQSLELACSEGGGADSAYTLKVGSMAASLPLSMAMPTTVSPTTTMPAPTKRLSRDRSAYLSVEPDGTLLIGGNTYTLRGFWRALGGTWRPLVKVWALPAAARGEVEAQLGICTHDAGAATAEAGAPIGSGTTSFVIGSPSGSSGSHYPAGGVYEPPALVGRKRARRSGTSVLRRRDLLTVLSQVSGLVATATRRQDDALRAGARAAQPQYRFLERDTVDAKNAALMLASDPDAAFGGRTTAEYSCHPSAGELRYCDRRSSRSSTASSSARSGLTRSPSGAGSSPRSGGSGAGSGGAGVDSAEADRSCAVCLDAAKNTALVPCGHVLCGTCASAVLAMAQHKCPICRRAILQTIKLFL